MKPKANTIHRGDCLAWLKKLDDDSVDMMVGSPPYPRKASRYGTGAKMSPAEWVDWMIDIARELVRVSRGFCWIVVNGCVKNGFYEPHVEGFMWECYRQGIGLDRPDIWHKNAAPTRNRLYLSNDYELVICLKSEPYPYFNTVALETAPKYTSGGAFRQRSNADGKRRKGSDYPKGPAAPRDVFRVIVGGGHTGFDRDDDKLANSGKAPFPLGVPERFIQLGCPPGGLVLDPWMGAGSTAVAAVRLGMNYCGAEMVNEELRLARRRLARITSK